MTLIGRHNIVKARSSTTGTGTLTLGSAVPGSLSFSSLTNGEIVTYRISDGVSTEIGYGTYTASGATLSRDTVLSSTNSGAKINCTGNEIVSITIAAEDISPFASYYTNTPDTVSDTTDNHVIVLDTEWVDQFDMASVGSNVITVSKKGWYLLWVNVQFYSSGTALNGHVDVDIDGQIQTRYYVTANGVASDQIMSGPTLYEVTTDNHALGQFKINNHSGVTLTASIYEATLFRIGNHL